MHATDTRRDEQTTGDPGAPPVMGRDARAQTAEPGPMPDALAVEPDDAELSLDEPGYGHGV